MSEEAAYEAILTERIGDVLRITLNRPEKRNALSYTLQDELVDVITKAQDGDARAIIIRGAGPSFSAGYDLTPNKTGVDAEAAERMYAKFQRVQGDVEMCLTFGETWGKIWHSQIPVIAQVHGFCLAGGTDLALHCDMIIMADDAKVGFPPVRSQGGPPTHMWIYHAGPQWSKRLLLTGDTISGKKCAEIGLALESVPAEELDEYVLKLATRVSRIGHDLLAHNKRIVNLGIELMGRSTMQTFAAIHDVLGHNAPEAKQFGITSRKEGLRAAVAERDAPFQD